MEYPQQYPVAEDRRPESQVRVQQPRSRLGLIIVCILIVSIFGLIIWYLRSQTPSEPSSPEPTASQTQRVVDPLQIPPATDPFQADRDRDGLDDAKEQELGTSHVAFDTDADGIGDADEINVWKTDPVNPDTDGDGFGDGFEVLSEYNPLGAGAL